MNYLGIDLGTGGVRALIVSAKGDVQASTSCPLEQINVATEPGHSEQRTADWRHALESVLAQLSGQSIDAVAVTSTSGTVLPEGGERALMHNDVRSHAEATELGVSPTFSLAKILWMQRHQGASGRFLHATDYVNELLTGTPVATDFTNAMKSGVDLETLGWPAEFATRYGLPPVVRPSTRLGQLTGSWGFGSPGVYAGATDSNAGFYASGATRVGDWSTTIGTTLAVKGICEDRIDDPDGRVYCHRHPDLAWLPGGACNAGGEILRLHFPDADFATLNQEAAARGPSEHIVYPLARKGERLPFINPDAEGFIEGDADDRVGLYGGCLQGVAFTERWIYELLTELGADTSGCVATTGGGARSDYWLQLRADILQREVIVPEEPECAFGAAILAAAGHREEPVAESASRMVRIARRFRPRQEIDWDSRYRRFRSLCAALVLLVWPLFADEPMPPEISGIAIKGDRTVIVANESSGCWFECDPDNPERMRRVKLAPELIKQASDLEDIAFLGDEVVVLSEDSAMLFAADRVVANYADFPELREVRNHGLEGLAIRGRQIAALFEGGRVPPTIYLHEVGKSGKLLKLDLATLYRLTGEAEGTKFRSPALVWSGAGFLMLLAVDHADRYERKWLIRCDLTGKIQGQPIPLTDLGMPAKLADKNWEGMAWRDDGRLLLVNDSRKPAHFVTIQAPE